MTNTTNDSYSKNTSGITDIIQTNYSDEMKEAYLSYAMSVIISRAIPDVRDGLKPVHRRILYAMNQLGLDKEKPHRKSARIVGDVLGKYHPHGDKAVYDAMVRMTQSFKMQLPLVDGHGNFGSIDGDSAAAMRYTEARLEGVAKEIMGNLSNNVVDFQNNFDDTTKEPTVMPSRIPNLLINGTTGIAVGISTNIPPHNLGETLDASIAYLENPSITIDEIMSYIKGPDFPTGGIIANQSDLREAYLSGSGKIKIRAKLEVEKGERGKSNIIVTEIPYTYAGDKTKIIEKIANLARDKKLEEISDIRDESNREGIRILIEVKKGTDIDLFINKLYKKTPLEDNFDMNSIALVDGAPKILPLKDIIRCFIEFQREIERKVIEEQLSKKEFRSEVLDGLISASEDVDTIIAIIRASKDKKKAFNCLVNGDVEEMTFKTKAMEAKATKLRYSKNQAEAILKIQLGDLISLELEKLKLEKSQIDLEIDRFREILSSQAKLDSHIKKYLKKIAKTYRINRRTEISELKEIEMEDIIVEENLYFLMDKFNYMKTVDEGSYNRAGENGLSEFTVKKRVLNTDKVVLFTNKGNQITLKADSIPKTKLREKGIPIESLFELSSNEKIIYCTTGDGYKDKLILTVNKDGISKLIKSSDLDTNRTRIDYTKIKDLPDCDNEVILVTEIDNDDLDSSSLLMRTTSDFVLKLKLSDIKINSKNNLGTKTLLKKNDVLKEIFVLDKDSINNVDILTLDNEKISVSDIIFNNLRDTGFKCSDILSNS